MAQAPDILGFLNQQKQERNQGIQNLGNSVAGLLRQRAQKENAMQAQANQGEAAKLLELASKGGEDSESSFMKAYQLSPKFVDSYLNAQKLRAESRDADNESSITQAALDIKEEDNKFAKGQKVLKGYNDASKDFVKVRDANARIAASIENPDAAGDIALIFNYMKMLDPGSTVREGEFATASNAGGVNTSIRNMFNKVQDGQRLQPEQREMFSSRANKLFSKAEEQNNRDKEQALNIGRRFGLEADDIFGQAESQESANSEVKPVEAQAPQAAIDYLMANPDFAAQFEAKFGYLPEGL